MVSDEDLMAEIESVEGWAAGPRKTEWDEAFRRVDAPNRLIREAARRELDQTGISKRLSGVPGILGAKRERI